MKADIFIVAQLAGTHAWIDAPEEVKYLRTPYRHIFHIKVGMAVTKLNRELEFFVEKKKLHDTLGIMFPDVWCGITDFGNYSCEQIARKILDSCGYYSWVEVNEDDENGSIIRRG